MPSELSQTPIKTTTRKIQEEYIRAIYNNTPPNVFAKNILQITHQSSWTPYNFNQIISRPPKPGKYFIHRKDGKTHWETWNGSGWAYNENAITHWQEIIPPTNNSVSNQ